MASAEMTSQQLSEKLDRLKADVSKKEGEQEAILAELNRDHGFKTLDAAYDSLDNLDGQIEAQKEKREQLLASVQKRLASYGY
jgi:chromosome segregation ATPase